MELQVEITNSIKRVVKRIYNGFIYQLNSSLESRYRCVKVRRTGVARPITRSINGFERTRMRSGSLMLLPIEGQKVDGIGPSSLE